MAPLDKNKGILAWLFLLLILTGESLALHINHIEVPEYKEKGKSAVLSCSYSLVQEELYSVKWYKGDKQFYQYIPANQQPVVTYHVPGFSVDELQSSNSTVVLEKLSFDATAPYKCEVISEGPLFHTANAVGNLTVIELPKSAPILSGLKKSYELGDLVNVNCTSGSSKPAATLEWHVNGMPLETEANLQRYPTNVEPETGLETAVLRLSFIAARHHFPESKLVLKCVARIASEYSQSEETTIEIDSLKLTQAEHSIQNSESFQLNNNGSWSLESHFSLIFITFGVIAANLCRIDPA